MSLPHLLYVIDINQKLAYLSVINNYMEKEISFSVVLHEKELDGKRVFCSGLRRAWRRRFWRER